MSFEQEKMIVGSLPSLYPLQKFEEEAINALVSLPIDDDAISRKAAIDAVEFGITYAKAINKETGEVTELFEESNAELQEAADRIKKLPSALPEHIIHCKDCENHLYRDWCRMVQHATSDYSDCAKELYAKRKGEQ